MLYPLTYERWCPDSLRHAAPRPCSADAIARDDGKKIGPSREVNADCCRTKQEEAVPRLFAISSAELRPQAPEVAHRLVPVRSLAIRLFPLTLVITLGSR
jgi:hypothetical protein